MKKGLIRRLAIYIAFFQLFSSSAMASNKYVLVNNSNPNNPIYQNYDDETDEYSNVSIFDNRNASHRQYGANQLDFDENHFYRVFQDPLIQEELKEISKDLEFDSLDHIETFYKTYLDSFSRSGCGYGAITNFVFRLFEGREEDFYNTFGYPMYKVMGSSINFNYEVFMLKYFNFVMKKTDFFQKLVDKADKTYYEKALPKYEEKLSELQEQQKEHKKSYRDKFLNASLEEYNEWAEVNKQYSDNIKKYKAKIKKIKNILDLIELDDKTCSLILDKDYGYIEEYLKQFGIRVSCTLVEGTKNVAVNDIIAAKDYFLTEVGYTGLATYDYQGPGYHAMIVSDITPDGKIIISSWGYMYEYDETKGTSYAIKIKVLK